MTNSGHLENLSNHNNSAVQFCAVPDFTEIW